MRTGFTELTTSSSGVFTRIDALAAGHTDRDLRAWVHTGQVRRLTRGVFALGPPPAYARERLIERAHGLARRHGDTLAMSHHTALALHGIAMHDVAWAEVYAVRLSGAVQCRKGLRVLRPRVPPPTTRVQGVLTVQPDVAVVQVAGAFGLRCAVVAADSALGQGHVDEAALDRELGRAGQIVGIATARAAVRRSCRGAQSPGETLLRLVVEDLGYAVQVQFPVVDHGPDPFAFADLRIVGTRSLLEFDGAIKYEGAEGKAALMAEKVREDRIRALGWDIHRVIWRDFDHLRALQARIDEAASRSRIPGSG